jgi:formyl-CoA transferase
MLDFQAARWTIAREVPEQAGNNHPTSIPTGVFATSDGHINIAAAGEDIWRRLCNAIEAPQLIEDPRFANGKLRSQNRDAVNAAIEAITVHRTSADWIERLNAAGVPSGPIYRMNEVFEDPQVRHLGIARKVPHKVLGEVEVIGQAIELSRTPWSVRSATPELGEHTDQILAQLGYSAAEVETLKAKGVV